MEFRTKINKLDFQPRIRYGDHLVCLGSCFAEEMGKKLAAVKIQVDINPAGILYNPVSLANMLQMAVSRKGIPDDHRVFHDGLWHSLSHHGVFSHPDLAELTKALRLAHEKTRGGLEHAKWLILTLGTAHVFRYLPKATIVANCHKIPNTQFTRERLSVKSCVAALERSIQLVRKVNPNISVLLSVSPVRHIRDGLVENQRSKSVLTLAVDEICKQARNVHYFPAYEICIDDLRDYRFYGEDLVHPANIAVNYIWERFQDAMLSEEARSLGAEISQVMRAISHRPIYRNTEKTHAFASSQLQKINQIKARFPEIDFDAEEAHFRKLLESE